MTRRPLLGPYGRRRLAAAVLPLALSISACGGGSDSADDSSSDSSQSSGETSEAASDEPAAGDEVETEEFMQVFEAAFEDATTARVTMTMDNAAGDMTGEGDADYTVSPPEMSMTMSGAALQGQQMETRMVDGVVYMKGQMLGPKWMSIDLNDPNNPLGPAFTKQLDPRAMFEGFGDGVQKVVYEGEEDGEGDTSDHYAVTVDSDAVFEAAGQPVPKGVEVPEAITYDMYFDEEGRYRRMLAEMGGQLGSVQIDMTDWGKEVAIQAPPAAEVTDFPGSSAAG